MRTFTTVRRKKETMARTQIASTRAEAHPHTLSYSPFPPTTIRGCGSTNPCPTNEACPSFTPFPFRGTNCSVAAAAAVAETTALLVGVEATSGFDCMRGDALDFGENSGVSPACFCVAHGTGLPVMPVAASSPDLNPSCHQRTRVHV